MEWEPHDRHWIRLRGAWEVAWIDENGREEPARRVRLPADWQSLFGDRRGTARFTRSFQRPTNLDADERVVVTLTNVRADVQCRLNDRSVPRLDRPLGEPACWPAADCVSFDLTEHLQSSNDLVLRVGDVAESRTPAGLHEPVLLEIVTLDDADAERSRDGR